MASKSAFAQDIMRSIASIRQGWGREYRKTSCLDDTVAVNSEATVLDKVDLNIERISVKLTHRSLFPAEHQCWKQSHPKPKHHMHGRDFNLGDHISR
ncbi:hypothetical protein [Desulfovibrio ferrophilus]|uniref:DNA ligase n=1 Tax=Desulfovibrio ferrophilus TaxID=241368 RepID=A0A2Z6AY50_9BACT|nr:hypothetical protein [Desulfovibrio ferrophilus]BBD08187.1 DNA ligase [Desulfovibrio ferrophilus]